MEKPTPEQIAWVVDCLLRNIRGGGTYRVLIADQFGYPDCYRELILAMRINNMASCLEGFSDSSKRVVETWDSAPRTWRQQGGEDIQQAIEELRRELELEQQGY